MKFITITELRLRATEIIRGIEESKEDVIVTKKGKPVVLMHNLLRMRLSALKEKKKESRLKRDTAEST